MPAKSIEPLKKVTVDLFETDVIYLRDNTENFSDTVRILVQHHVIMLKASEKRMTLGELPND